MSHQELKTHSKYIVGLQTKGGDKKMDNRGYIRNCTRPNTQNLFRLQPPNDFEREAMARTLKRNTLRYW